MTKDPICGMTVDESSALRAERDGQTFYFCGDHCRKKFLSAPATAKHEEKPPGKVIYTCPMHPEVQQDHPGNCPKCGMALEPKTVSAVEEENPELADMSRRFWIGAALLTLPVFVLAMAHTIPALGHESWVMGDASRWIQFVLSTPGGAVGGLAVLQTRLAFTRHLAVEYVHAHRHRRGHGLFVQRGGDARAGRVSDFVRA